MAVPIIEGHQKFTETVFYKWLLEKYQANVHFNSFIEAIKVYTKFVEHPFKGRSDGQYHKWAYEAFISNIKKENPWHVKEL